MSTDGEQLAGELKRLRRNEGRTLLKLLACPNLRLALGDPAEAELVERFDAAIAFLGNDLKSLALKNAYGIGAPVPGILKTRRETFGAQAAVDRGPETINNWEDERIEELRARLLAGVSAPVVGHLMVAVGVAAGRISVVAEGEAESGAPMRQWFNPNTDPFLPAFIYVVPSHLSPRRLTLTALFLDQLPTLVYADATGDLLAFVCGDGRQKLELIAGGLPGLEAAAHVAVHYDSPMQGIYYGLAWQT